MLPNTPKPPQHDDLVKHFAKERPAVKLSALALVMAPSILRAVAALLVAIVGAIALRFLT